MSRFYAKRSRIRKYPRRSRPSGTALCEILTTKAALEGGIRLLLTEWGSGFWPPPGRVLESAMRYQLSRDQNTYATG